MEQHNKSQKTALSIVSDFNAEELAVLWRSFDRFVVQDAPLPCPSKCFLSTAQDGRFTINGKKVFFSYQLAAYAAFGFGRLSDVPAKKIDEDSLVISHICGNGPLCCNPTHLELEPKRINDERTHCHFVINQILQNSGRDEARRLKSKICFHVPKCCSL